MNHEEHVNQLKSEVRYIQEVVNDCGGALACAPLPAPAGACGEGPGRSASPGASRGVPRERAAMPAPAAALEPRLSPSRSGKLAAELNSAVG